MSHSLWRTYPITDRPFISWARCLWCGERGHFQENCARIHAHGAVTRNGVCLGCRPAPRPESRQEN